MGHFCYLRTRLILSHLLAALAGILLLGGLAAHFLVQEAYHHFEHNLDEMATLAVRILESELDSMNTPLTGPLQAQLADLFESRPEIDYALYGADRSLLLARRTPAPDTGLGNALEINEAWESDLGKGVQQRQNQNGEPTMYIAVRIQHGYYTYGVLQIAAPTQAAAVHAQEGLLKLALACALAAILVWALGWLLSEHIARPMRALTTTASAYAQGEMDQRVIPDGPYEMRQLAEILNKLADQTQATMHELRLFVANASHELRTPLTVMKLRIEALQGGSMKDPRIAGQFITEIESEIDRLARTINDLLDLSKMETNAGNRTNNLVNALEVVEDVHSTFQIRAHKGGMTLELQQQGEQFDILGSEDHLHRLLANLVDNAIKFSPPGSRVILSATSDPAAGKVLLRVSDDGPGIPVEHLPHIFERFYRVEKTQPRGSPRRGSGLGLAIAKAIAENLGGSIQVESRLGAGAIFSVDLPLATGDKKAGVPYSELPSGSLRTASQRSQ